MELRISGFTHDKEVEIHIQVEDVIQIAVAASREILKIYNTDIEVTFYFPVSLRCTELEFKFCWR
jgi:hypothetical protein